MTARALEEHGIRLKQYQHGEHRASCPECDRRPMVLVRQLEPGSRGQIPFTWRRGEPLPNVEAVSERLFWALVTGADVTILERPLPEGRR